MKPLWRSAASSLASLICVLPLRAEATLPSHPYTQVSAEAAHPDRGTDGYDAFRANLLDPKISDFYLVSTDLGGIYLVVQKDYLNPAELKGLIDDLILAVHKIPEMNHRPPLVTKRFTAYVFPDSPQSPMSSADVPGAQPGERGIMFDFVKEKMGSIFHEMTHLLAGGYERADGQWSSSLTEGVAQWAQEQIRPAERYHNVGEPAIIDPHRVAKNALDTYPRVFKESIGAPGHPAWSGQGVRTDFYVASWSFVDFLIDKHGGIGPLWKVIDGAGEPQAYAAAYPGESYDSLIAEWTADLARRAAANP